MGGRQSVKPGSPLHTQYVSAIIYLRCYFNSFNINNRHDIVYGAVIMTKVIARVHPVHLMNVDWAPGGRQPLDQASRLGIWVSRKLAAIIHIHCQPSTIFCMLYINVWNPSPAHVIQSECCNIQT